MDECLLSHFPYMSNHKKRLLKFFSSFKKAKILNAMGQYDQAANLLEDLLKNNPANVEARNKLTTIRLDQMKNKIRLSYTYDCFKKKSNKDPWYLAALSYGRKTSFGTVIGRVITGSPCVRL